jgi:PAS domain S-box-containing protein
MSSAIVEGQSWPEGRIDALAYARSIVETAREPLVILNSHLRVQSANHAFYQTFRVSPQDAHDQLLYDLGNRQWDIPRLHTLLEEILPPDTVFNDYEVEHDFPAIGRKVMLLNARRLHQEGTELILLAIEDVTERRRAEADRCDIETRFTSLVKNIKDHAIFTLDPEGRVTSWNVAAEQVLGYTEAEALGQHFAFIFTPEDCLQGLPKAELRAARDQDRAEDERWHLRKGGERFWALGIVSALRDAQGRLTGFSKILRDMTAGKRAEESLQATEKRLRRMLNVDVVGMLIFDGSGTFVEANDAFLRMSGYGREEIHARALNWRVMTPPEHVAESERQLRLLAETGRVGPYEKECVRKDGSRVWMLFAGASLGDGTAVQYCVNVDDHRRAEEALRQSETKYRTLFDSIDEGFGIIEVIFDERDTPVDFRYLETNPAFERHTGLANARGKSIRAFAPALEESWFEIFGRVARTGEASRFQKRAAQLDRWFDIYAWRYGQPQDRQVAALFSDITLQKRTEEALHEANRRKDEFLATLAHELRTPLTPIRTGVDLIQALRGDAVACEAPLRIMDRQVSHLVRLVDDLLDVSRISRGKIQLRKEQLELAEIIHAALDMSESSLSQGDRHVSVNVPSQSLPVDGDRVRLVQVFANLLDNADKFTNAGGRIDIRVTPRGERVEIQVQDDGRGIPRERLDNIFEMFTQAEPGFDGGLGIGLSLVRGLTEMHGGTVIADSAGPGRGATFTVSLPLCCSAPAQPAADEAADLGVLPAECRVLAVDDNRDITEGLRLLLTILGAEVRVAHEGAEAVRICEEWLPTHVLMDIGMPGMDGYEAARRLRAKHPDSAFRLIAVTGWGQEEDRQRAREAGFDEHLVKPVRVPALKAVLSR